MNFRFKIDATSGTDEEDLPKLSLKMGDIEEIVEKNNHTVNSIEETGMGSHLQYDIELEEVEISLGTLMIYAETNGTEKDLADSMPVLEELVTLLLDNLPSSWEYEGSLWIATEVDDLSILDELEVPLESAGSTLFAGFNYDDDQNEFIVVVNEQGEKYRIGIREPVSFNPNNDRDIANTLTLIINALKSIIEEIEDGRQN